MLFNSLEFAILLPIVFFFYWYVTGKNIATQNLLLLFSSYVFYGWWDWRYLCLLVLLSVTNYLIGIAMSRNPGTKMGLMLFALGLVVNLGVLVVFKYFNFFIDSFIDLVSLVGYELPRSTTNIIIPVGISFYTFLSLSYIIDIHKKNLTANRNIVEVLLSLSFFPIILAGPIQRPALLLPQISVKRVFDPKQAISGFWQAMWGLIAKVIVADNLAQLVNDIFENFPRYPGSILFIGAILFSIQIYVDFSAYSNMAIGIARLFGFNLMKNFSFPYFSKDIVEFWKRWHISLTTWFRDYIFLPLSFNLAWKIESGKVFYIKKDLFIYIVGSIVVWLLTGLWHGSNYTYILWGLIHGFALILYKVQIKPRKLLFKKLHIPNNNTIIAILEALLTGCIVIVSWVFFRADNVQEAILFLERICGPSLIAMPKLVGIQNTNLLLAIIFSVAFFIIEWKNRHNDFVLEAIITRSIYFQSFVIGLIVMGIYLFSGESLDFIYFKF